MSRIAARITSFQSGNGPLNFPAHFTAPIPKASSNKPNAVSASKASYNVKKSSAKGGRKRIFSRLQKQKKVLSRFEKMKLIPQTFSNFLAHQHGNSSVAPRSLDLSALVDYCNWLENEGLVAGALTHLSAAKSFLVYNGATVDQKQYNFVYSAMSKVQSESGHVSQSATPVLGSDIGAVEKDDRVIAEFLVIIGLRVGTWKKLTKKASSYKKKRLSIIPPASTTKKAIEHAITIPCTKKEAGAVMEFLDLPPKGKKQKIDAILAQMNAAASADRKLTGHSFRRSCALTMRLSAQKLNLPDLGQAGARWVDNLCRLQGWQPPTAPHFKSSVDRYTKDVKSWSLEVLPNISKIAKEILLS